MHIREALISPESLYHAYLVGGDAQTLSAITAQLEAIGISIQGNPDVYVRSADQFGVSDARDIRTRAQSRSFGTGPQVFLLSCTSITNEAQNALLKVFEEPTPRTVFFLVVYSADSILPTLRSRMQEIICPHEDTIDASEFLTAAPKERLAYISKLVEAQDAGRLLGFLASLERALGPLARTDASVRRGLHAVYTARRYITDKGALKKALLEQVAILTPRVSPASMRALASERRA